MYKRNNHEFKRVKERSVKQVSEKVHEWRELFENGKYDDNGNHQKLTLQQAAIEVGIPKKTLEDYHQLLKKVEQVQPIEQLFDKKMGYLRQLIKSQQCRQDELDDQTEMEYEDFNYEGVQQKQGEQIEEENLDNYFNLNNEFKYYGEADVMTVHIEMPQISVNKKLTDPWETQSDTYDSGNETETD